MCPTSYLCPNWGRKVAKCQNTKPQTLNILVKIKRKKKRKKLCVFSFFKWRHQNRGCHWGGKGKILTHCVQFHRVLPQIWAEQRLTGAFWKSRLAFQWQAVTFRVGTQSCLSVLPQLFNGNTFAWKFEMVSALPTLPECHSPRSTL